MTLQNEYDEDLLLAEEDEVEDDSEKDESVSPIRYDITSFGIDFDVEGVFRRVKRGEIFIPEFQRNYIWNIKEASRFIESLLLGLPVPGIFLAQDQDTGKFLVIDGQQRLKSLLFYYEGFFNPSPNDKTRRVFKLTGVQPQLEDLTYEDLQEKDRLTLDNSVLHATVVKQDAPADDDTSMYHIFERLNSGGRRLMPQEMRSAIYHGKLIDTIKVLNEYPNWRTIFGKPNQRLKDQELILRFLAMYYQQQNYRRPMVDFLNAFAQRHRDSKEKFLKEASTVFKGTIDAFYEAVGQRAFRLRTGGGFNAAVFDSAALGLAKKIQKSDTLSKSKILQAYNGLLEDEVYMRAVSQATSNEASVELRMKKSTEIFAKL